MEQRKLRFYASCVGWPLTDVHIPGGLTDLIKMQEPVSRETFLRHVDPEELRQIEQQLGYAAHWKQGLTMARDWHVGYFKSQLHGTRVYGFTWSAIEYVFV